MANSTLLQVLTDDINTFAGSLNFVLSNERHLQVELTIYLRSLKNHYDSVEVEYPVPLESLGFHRLPRRKKGSTEPAEPFEGCAHNFPWPQDIIYLDIVVGKDGKYAIVELKYATRTIPQSLYDRSRFSIPSNHPIITTQGAQDLVMYRYCKDIRRIEYIAEKFSTVVGGVALLITNDHLYWDNPNGVVAYQKFSLHEGNIVKDGVWTGNFKLQPKFSDFSLSGLYTCHWENTSWDKTGEDKSKEKKGYIFRYLLETIDKKNLKN